VSLDFRFHHLTAAILLVTICMCKQRIIFYVLASTVGLLFHCCLSLRDHHNHTSFIQIHKILGRPHWQTVQPFWLHMYHDSITCLFCQSAVHLLISASSSWAVQAMWHDDSLHGLLHRAHERSMDQSWVSSMAVNPAPEKRCNVVTMLEQQTQKQYLSQVIMEVLRITADQ